MMSPEVTPILLSPPPPPKNIAFFPQGATLDATTYQKSVRKTPGFSSDREKPPSVRAGMNRGGVPVCGAFGLGLVRTS